jgi:hypothetical protein
MPYKNWKEVNSSLKNIKPQISLEMANHIADLAETMDAEKSWPIAIQKFKREYTVRGGKWVMRQELAEASAQETIARLAKEWNMLLPVTNQEAITLKAHAKQVLADLNSILMLKGVSPKLRKEVEDVKAELKKNWADLADVVDNQAPAKEEDEGDKEDEDDKEETEERGAVPAVATVEDGVEDDTEPVEEEGTTMKKGSESFPCTDFLVYEDKEKPTTWHLQVKKHGKPDHTLMGGAWAALHGGYRGNKYEGPNKAAALSKLKKMYEEEDMPMPGLSEVAVGLNTLTSMVSDAFRKQWSDSHRDTSQGSYPSLPWVKEVFIEHPSLGSSIICEMDGVLYMVPFDMDPASGVTFAPKAVWQPVVQTYVPVPKPASAYEAEPVREAEIEYLEETVLVESLNEDSDERNYIQLEEAAGLGEVNDVVPLRMDVAFIYPGFGNKRDGHYYPLATLKRDAPQFKGLKMYESDHRASEKSTRTWVSTIEDVAGFTPEGAPIAKVVVHEPNFARRVRALSAAGQLNKLECSILASGKARKGKVDGKDAKIVEEITDAESVDWVTRAGAGGKALQLSESGLNTEKEVPMSGQEGEQDVKPTEETPATEAVAETHDETPAPVSLAEDVVLAELGKVRLPEVTKAKLAKGSYTTVEELNKAVGDEVAYLKEATASGKPFEQNGESKSTETKLTEAEYESKMAAIGEKYGIGIYHKEVNNA